MKILKKISAAAVAFAALSASVAPAFAESFYSAPVTAPIINQGGVTYSSADWSVDPLTAGKLITSVSYNIKYTVTKYSSSPYALQVRVCQRLTSSTPCSMWGPANVATPVTDFNNFDATKPFFLQAKVTGTTTLLNPKPGAAGNSMLTVGYQ